MSERTHPAVDVALEADELSDAVLSQVYGGATSEGISGVGSAWGSEHRRFHRVQRLSERPELLNGSVYRGVGAARAPSGVRG